jgi:hypothetical protein
VPDMPTGALIRLYRIERRMSIVASAHPCRDHGALPRDDRGRQQDTFSAGVVQAC